jgi:hypothetical protein
MAPDLKIFLFTLISIFNGLLSVDVHILGLQYLSKYHLHSDVLRYCSMHIRNTARAALILSPCKHHSSWSLWTVDSKPVHLYPCENCLYNINGAAPATFEYAQSSSQCLHDVLRAGTILTKFKGDKKKLFQARHVWTKSYPWLQLSGDPNKSLST